MKRSELGSLLRIGFTSSPTITKIRSKASHLGSWDYHYPGRSFSARRGFHIYDLGSWDSYFIY
jgi:hypothetical protein